MMVVHQSMYNDLIVHSILTTLFGSALFSSIFKYLIVLRKAFSLCPRNCYNQKHGGGA